MKRRIKGSALEALTVLLLADRPLTVKQIQAQMLVPMERKQIYNMMDTLECLGYKVERDRICAGPRNTMMNTYKVSL